MSIFLNMVSDAGLVRRVLAGNSEAFGILVQRHLLMVQSLAWSHCGISAETEDIAQEAFLRAYTKLDTLRDGEKFSAWIAGITRNMAHDVRARLGRMESAEDSLLNQQAAPARRVEEEELHALLREAVGELDESASEVLTLHYFAGKSTREIATIQGVTREAAMKRLQRAREALGKQLLARLEGAPRRQERMQRQKTAIVAAVLAMPVAWQASAAVSSVSVGGTAIALAAVAALGALGYGGYAQRASLFGAGATADVAVIESGVGEPAVLESPGAVKTAATEAPGTNVEAVAKVSGRIFGTVLDLHSVPQPHVMVRMELMDWHPQDMPPAETFTRETRSDAEGKFVFEDLNWGRYGFLATLGATCDVAYKRIEPAYPERSVELLLKPGLPIEGRVVDSMGRGIAGVVLHPYAHESLGIVGEEPSALCARVESGEQGRFRFDLLWPGAWRIKTIAAGRPAVVSEDIVAGERNALITIPMAARVVGSILRSDSKEPVSEAEITLRSVGPDALSAMVKSDAAGQFAFDNLAPGAYTVQLGGGVGELSSDPGVLSLQAGHDYPLELTVGGGGTLSGWVIADDTGEALPGIVVWLGGKASEHLERRNLTTDATGSFFYAGLPEGLYEVFPQSGLGYLVPESNPPVHVRGQGEVEVTIKMRRGIPISGIVVDANGAPVPYAWVGIHVRNGGVVVQEASVSSGEKGEFHSAFPLDVAGELRIIATGDNHHSDPYEAVLQKEGHKGLQIKLVKGMEASVTLKVNMEQLRDMAASQGLEAVLRPVDNLYMGRSMRLPLNGSVEFENVVAGSYTAYLMPSNGMDRTLCDVEQFEVPPQGETVVDMPCGFKGDLMVAGIVLDRHENPITGATVTLEPETPMGPKPVEVMTDAEGRFSFENVPAGAISLYVKARGYLRNAHRLTAGDVDILVTLREATDVKIRVLDDATSAPIAAFGLQIYGPDDDFQDSPEFYRHVREGYSTPITAPDGRHTIKDLPILGNFIVVTVPGYKPEQQPAIDIGDQELVFRMKQGMVVSGLVREPGGNPLSGVLVSVGSAQIQSAEMSGFLSSSDLEGRFELKGVLPGIWLYFKHPDFADTKAIVPDSGKLEVTMDAGGSLAGVVYPPPSGNEQCEVTLVDAETGTRLPGKQMQVARDGRFRFGVLPTGPLMVAVLMRLKILETGVEHHWGGDYVPVDIVAGREARVTLDKPVYPEDEPVEPASEEE